MKSKFRIGSVWLTKGGWLAVVCNENTIFHQGKCPGQQLRTFDPDTGKVRSGQVFEDHDLLYEVLIK